MGKKKKFIVIKTLKRRKQVIDGLYDGRYKTKIFKTPKDYNRKNKDWKNGTMDNN